MPAPLDLTGRRFGGLTVQECGPRVTYGGLPQWSWITRCDCGAVEAFPQKRLTSGRQIACTRCSLPKCGICGTPFERKNPNQRYCSEECAAEAEKRNGREHYHRKTAADPGFNHRRGRRATARADENTREKRKAAQAAHRQRVREDPERRERAREYSREYARAWRDLLRLDPEEYERWKRERAEKTRDYSREWAAKWRARLTDEQREELRLRRIERDRQKALDELMQIVAVAKNKKGRDRI